MDSGRTGNFEVNFLPTNELIHSKSTRGQGRCESEAETQAIISYIKRYKAKIAAAGNVAPEEEKKETA